MSSTTLSLGYAETKSLECACYFLLNSTPIEYWRVGALKVAKEEGSNLLSSKEVTMATEPQAPVNTTLNRKYQCVELILTQKIWDGGREKQASKLAEQLQQRNSSKSTWQCPCRPPCTPHQILGKWQHWLDFNFA